MNDQGVLEYSNDRGEGPTSKLFFYGPDDQFVNAKYQKVLQRESLPHSLRLENNYRVIYFHIKPRGNTNKALDVNPEGSATLVQFNETSISQKFFYAPESNRIVNAKYFKVFDVADDHIRIILSAPDLDNEMQVFEMLNDDEIYSLHFSNKVMDVHDNEYVILGDRDVNRVEQKWTIWYGADMTLLVGANNGTIAARFIGSYGSEIGDGTFTQDHSISGLENDSIFVESNNQATLVGNSWKAFQLEPSYNIRRDTMLRFSFKVEEEAEGHAICLEDDLSEDTYSGRSRRCIALAGTQIDKWNYVFSGDQFSSGDSITKTYAVPVGRMFDNLFKVNYIAFIQDNDLEADKGNSTFADISLTDDYNGPEISNKKCPKGFISFATGAEFLQGPHDSCVSSLFSDNIKITSSSIQFWSFTIASISDKVLSRRVDPDNEIKTIDLSDDRKYSNSTIQIDDTTAYSYNFTDLKPGVRYEVSFSYVNGAQNEIMFFPAVTSCSCGSEAIDRTGRPENLQIQQEGGHVMFSFIDNSVCEEAFSFTRSDYVEEFLSDVSEYGVSFTRDYYFNGGRACGGKIKPMTEASDNLVYSKLEVGKLYSYCARAVRNSHYMDHPFDGNNIGRTLTSSDDTCGSHRIRWEASVQGRITTEPNAGNLPIKNVTVAWELLNNDLSSIEECKECSGIVMTKDSGKFVISLNVDNPSLHHKNDVNFPVRVRFFKVSGTGDAAIEHRFVCNDGEDDCSGDLGTIKYLSHLQFLERLDIYDDTSVPYSGKLIISDTGIGNPCTIANAKVCLVQYRSSGGVNGVKDYLVCGNTDSNGEYSLPVIIGSRVDDVEIDYHEHDFVPTPDGKFSSGEVIEASTYYGDRDFEDRTKARLFVEVAGGLCNKYLGMSTVQVRIVGCEWKGLEMFQTVVRGTYNNIPGHLLEIQVNDVEDDNGRIQPIFTHFQGQQPETRFIDLTDAGASDEAVKGASSSVRSQGMKTGTENKQMIEEEADNAEEIRKEEENLELVRFEYIGDLKLDVFIAGDNLGCSNYTLSDFSADSLHLLDKFEIFEVRVSPKYEISRGVYCDIVNDDLEIIVENQVGLGDPNSPLSDEDKRQIDGLSETEKQMLSYCQSGCRFGFEHDTDEETGETLGNARFSTFLGTGQPSIVEPYAKYIIFRVENVQHKAAVVIQGDYSKGPGRSFALPSSKPIMILRDPPGGLSYATYENVKTTLKLRTVHELTTTKNNFGLAVKQQIGSKVELCSGGGFGVLVIACNEPLEIQNTVKVVEASQSIGGILQHDEEVESNQFTITWSYKTSSDSWLAGAMSDVFVVPNLNVEFQEVMEVRWDSRSCKVFEEKDSPNNPPLPVQIAFDINSPTRKEALAFYSRYHVQYSKLPDLYSSIAKINKNIEDCKCGTVDEISNTDCSCPSTEQKKKALQDAVADWIAVLKESEDTVTGISSTNSIINWFDNVGQVDMHTAKDVSIKDHPSSLLPPDLSRSATDKNTERIQFSGGGNLFSMQMKKEKAKSMLTKANWRGPNIHSESNIKGPGLEKNDAKSFENGIDFFFNLLDFTVDHEHESTKKTDKSDETIIGFVLGDNDPGDEFVVDLYYDEEYGSIIFKTVSGVSNCPHEEGTIAFAVPDIRVTRYAPSIVFPDDTMEFEVELVNKGVGNSTSFHMFSRQMNNQDSVLVQAAGKSLASESEFDHMEPGVPYKRRITVKKDSGLYKNKAVDIVFENACQDNDSTINGLTTSIFNNSQSSTATLYNTVEGEGEDIEKFLTFVHPCDKVEWAGELNRDRGFLVNTNSDAQDHLLVTAFNPSYSDKKFCNMTSDRLENIHLSYRREGDVHWKTAITEVDNHGGSTSLDVLDFSNDCNDENDYGYISKEWRLGNAVPEGRYEIKLGSQCHKLGGPDDIDRYDAPTLTGVIDLTRPEQYGQPLPLRDQVLIGEEISVVFTEDLDCGKPYSFGMKVEIEETDYTFDREELQVTCEGRKIGFQIDPTMGIDLDKIMGKIVKVEIGKIHPNSELNIFDANGNSIDPNKGDIKFEKTLTSLNLDEAATSFRMTVNGSNCTDAISGSYSDELKKKIVSVLNIEIARIEVLDVDCKEENVLTATVKILPINDNRRKLRSSLATSGDHAVDLFYTLRDISLQKEVPSRKLVNDEITDGINEEGTFGSVGNNWLFSISGLKILPSPADLEKVRTDPILEEEEKELKYWSMSSQSVSGDISDQGMAHLQQRIANMQNIIIEQGQMSKEQDKNYEYEIKSLIMEQARVFQAREENYEHEMKTMLKELAVIMVLCTSLSMVVLLHIWRK